MGMVWAVDDIAISELPDNFIVSSEETFLAAGGLIINQSEGLVKITHLIQ